MTGPFPGQGEIPQPWDGHPPPVPDYSDYGVQGPWPDPAYPDPGDDDGGPFGGPPRGPSRKVVAAIAAAVVVVVGAGVALWWFAVGPGHADTPRPVAATNSQPPPIAPVVHPPSSSPSPDAAAAYDVGSCFDEAPGIGSGKVELNPVDCGAADAVFVINRVVGTTSECDAGADFRNHGYEVPDETANVAYCASLVVPADDCITLASSRPIARTPCGTGPNVVRVLAIESAPSPATACKDKTDPDVWYYQSPSSGQFACLSRPAPAGSTTAPTTAPPTTTP